MLRRGALQRAVLIGVAVLAAGLALARVAPLRASPVADSNSGCEANSPDAPAIRAALANALDRAPRQAGGQWRVVSVCQQGQWAYGFIKGYTAAGAPLPSTSLVAVAQLTDASWQVTLPGEAAYGQALAALPAGLVPAQAQALLGPSATHAQAAASSAWVNFSGFALPYPAGQSAYVFWHWYPALDFSIGDPGPGDSIRAAKSGTAVFVKDSSTVECGDPPPNWTCWMYANAVVIQSGPNEYAWYLHLAAHTIPAWLHEGASVPAGADIGQEGMTGWASLPHVHFMVSTGYACCTGEGDGRFPSWPQGATLPIDFNEYSWSAMPAEAVSQNGLPPATAVPPPAAAAPPASTPEPSLNPTATAAPSAGPPSTAAPDAAQNAAAALCTNPYVVQPGDYLFRIATQCNVAETALLSANPSLNPNLIFAGQLLNMPSTVSLGGRPDATAAPAPTEAAVPAGRLCAGTHIVAPGESLFQIATACGLTWQQLAQANGVGYPYTIYAGQSLAYP